MKIRVVCLVVASVAFLFPAATTCSGVLASITGLPSQLDQTVGPTTNCSVSIPVVTSSGSPFPFAGASTAFTANSVQAHLQTGSGGDAQTNGTVTDTNVFVNLP